MHNQKRSLGFLLFVFVLLVYTLTSPNTISYWDSSEFIVSNYYLQPSHPPGAPFYSILSSTLLSFFSSSYAAVVSNFISAFFGALTVLLVFLIAVLIVERLQVFKNSKYKQILSLSTGLLGALTLAFSPSFWTASTEAEVYTLSFALMLLICFFMIKWEQDKSANSFKWMLLSVFLLGISVGVHIIILTVLISLSVLVINKKEKLSFKNVLITLGLACLLFLAVHTFLIHGLISLATKLDVYVVNDFDLPINSGFFILLILIVVFFCLTHYIFSKINKKEWQRFLLLPIFFIIGMSTYLMPLLRANSEAIISNNISNPNRLSQYIKGEQFGLNKIPLLFGHTFNAPLDVKNKFIDTDPVFAYDTATKNYEVTNNGSFMKVNYASEFSMFFPRLYSLKEAKGYKDWTYIKGKPIAYDVKGEKKIINKPTFGENISFFVNYQSYWLYLRYLLWNFVGKQNDNHGLGYIKDGNWQSGFNFIDKYFTGDKSKIPNHYKDKKSSDVFYAIPLLLGILGLIALRKKTSYLLLSILLFLTFGIGIIIYVNPVPSSILVRERDYIFLGSFIIYSLWVGFAVVFVFKVFKQINKISKPLLMLSLAILFLAGPIQMFAKGLDNQNRSDNTFAYRFGKAYLDSCPKNAIVFTNGDNMTFPLLYIQEIENYRTDVRIINFDQLSIDSYINKLLKNSHESKALNFNLNKSLYVNGADKLLPLQEDTSDFVNVILLTRFLNQENTLVEWNGRSRHYIPSSKFELVADTSYFSNTFDLKSLRAEIIPEIKWEYPKEFYGLNEIVALNIIANNWSTRPICFLNNGKLNHYLGLQNYTIQNGLVDVLAPIKRMNKNDNPKIVDTKINSKCLLDVFDFKGLNDFSVHKDPESKVYAQQILRRNYYFTAQALLEEGDNQTALEVLNKCIALFPNKIVPFRQYTFAIGKLYCRLGKVDKGVAICKQSMLNIWQEINWIASIDSPPFSTINVRHANILFNMYKSMSKQLSNYTKQQPVSLNTLLEFEKEFNIWKAKNWKY